MLEHNRDRLVQIEIKMGSHSLRVGVLTGDNGIDVVVAHCVDPPRLLTHGGNPPGTVLGGRKVQVR